MLKSGAVIYRIVCAATGLFYVGSALRPDARWRCHLSRLRGHRHHSAKLQAAFDQHPETSFTFEILEHCEPSQLLEREQVWIDANWPCLYNTSPTAQNRSGSKMPLSAKLTIAKSLIGNQRRRGIPHDEVTKRRIGASVALAIAEGRKRVAIHPENLRAFNDAVKRGDKMHPSRNPERDAAIVAMHAATKSPTKTAKAFNVTAGAVWCVVKRCNPSQLRAKRKSK